VSKIFFDALRHYVLFCKSFISHNTHVPVSCARKVLSDSGKTTWKKCMYIQRALIVPSIIITKHGKSDAMRVIIFYTWQHFSRWKNRDKNEMKLHWPPLRESKTMATFYHIYNIFNAQIEGDWRVKYFRFSSPLNSFGALLGLRFFFYQHSVCFATHNWRSICCH